MDNTTVHTRCEDFAHLVDLFTFQGRPRNVDQARPVVVLMNHGYVVGFSPSRLQPVWAAYRVAGSERDVDFDRPHLYYEDTRLDPDWRVGPETFGRVGGIQYHVGHMVPNEVINRQFGRLAQTETFFMSNMSPQRASFNTGVWLDLEDKIRNIEDTDQKDHVWAIAGPIFSEQPDTITRPNGTQVPIPEAYYYITVDPFQYPWDRRTNVDIACFLMPQDAPRGTPLSSFLVDLTQIEAATKLSFFPGWSDAVRAAPAAAPSRERHRLLRQLGG